MIWQPEFTDKTLSRKPGAVQLSRIWGAVQNDGHYFCGTGGNRPDGLNEPVTILAEDVSVRLIGIKFFADSKMDEFIKDLGEKLNDGNPLEGSSLSLF
ncbi:tail protein from Bacteriophage (fragment) [Escherichia coli]